MNRTAIYYFLLITIIGGSCKNKAVEQPKEPVKEIPESFWTFYQQFFTDSLYQIEHISFPLQGVPSFTDLDSIGEGSYFFHKDSWNLHKPFTPDSTFQQEFVIVIDMIEERIFDRTESFQMKRRYAEVQGSWNLIYYESLNPSSLSQ